jgi:hypothetical protein
MLDDLEVTGDIMDYALNGTPETACRALWLRVIQYAKLEVTSTNCRTKTSGGFLQDAEKTQALRFLQGRFGDLEQVCELAGVSSRLIKKWANNYERGITC